MNKKGVIDQLMPLITVMVALAIALVVGFLVLDEVKTQTVASEGAGQFGDNATQDVMNALDDIPGWFSIIIITLIGALLIGLVSYFRGRR